MPTFYQLLDENQKNQFNQFKKELKQKKLKKRFNNTKNKYRYFFNNKQKRKSL